MDRDIVPGSADDGDSRDKEDADSEHVRKMPVVEGCTGQLEHPISRCRDEERDQIMRTVTVQPQQKDHGDGIKHHKTDPAQVQNVKIDVMRADIYT